MSRIWQVAILLTCAMQAVSAQAPAPITVADTSHVQQLRLRDGSTLIGRVTSVDGDSVRVRMLSGSMVTLPAVEVSSVRTSKTSLLRNGELWPESPNPTRLLFAPTGRQLGRGKGYFSNYDIFFIGANVGLTERASLGGGMTILPTDNFLSDQVYFVTPKVGLVQTEDLNVAVGALAGFLGAGIADESRSFGVLYGVATMGSVDHSVTTGAGFGYYGNTVSGKPALMLGTEQRLSKHTSFVSENYLFTAAKSDNVIVSYGLRIFGERISVDLAFVNSPSSGFFPGVPFVDFVVAF